MKTNKLIITILVIAFLLISSSPVLAHRMFIEPIEPGIVKVQYEGGGFSTRTEVVVYDANKNELESGELDNEGYYHYSTDLGAELIVADDGLGHRVEWKVGEEIAVAGGTHRWVTISLVVAGFLVVSGFFYYRKKLKENKKASV